MKAVETHATPRPAPRHPLAASLGYSALVVGRGHTQILATHGPKLAVVYVRQSSLQQVLEHRASTARQ